MDRQHVITLVSTLAVALTAGCSAQAPVTAARLSAAPKAAAARPVAERQHVAAPSAVTRKVNEQHAAFTVKVPAAYAGTGAVAMEFVFPKATGYSLKATAADIAKITVTLKTRSFLLMKTVATAEVLRTQIVNGRAAVNFTGLTAGSYTLDIVAADAAGANIGSGTTTANVTDGNTTMVDAQLKLVPSATPTPTPTPATTGLGVNVSIIDG